MKHVHKLYIPYAAKSLKTNLVLLKYVLSIVRKLKQVGISVHVEQKKIKKALLITQDGKHIGSQAIISMYCGNIKKMSMNMKKKSSSALSLEAYYAQQLREGIKDVDNQTEECMTESSNDMMSKFHKMAEHRKVDKKACTIPQSSTRITPNSMKSEKLTGESIMESVTSSQKKSTSSMDDMMEQAFWENQEETIV